MGLAPSILGSIFIFVLDETLLTINLVTKASNLCIIMAIFKPLLRTLKMQMFEYQYIYFSIFIKFIVNIDINPQMRQNLIGRLSPFNPILIIA
jgi:hypothetical protein